jgi:glutamine amidotransferase
MIAIIDYNVGNLFSVKNALDFIGEKSEITSDTDKIKKADSLILPGVGAFPHAMRQLAKTGLIEVIKAETAKKPLLGICLGMQLLFDKSYEFEECEGLGLIDGEIKKIETEALKIPHMGWNSLKYQNPCPLLDGIYEGCFVYFVHSYMAVTQEKNIAAFAEYGVKIPALVYKNNVFGAQFHPEKSSETGLCMLKNFGGLTK